MRAPILGLLSITIVAGGISGCASIVSGPGQSVSVESNPCIAATCELHNDKCKWYVSRTPGSVTIQRSYEELAVICRKDDETSPTATFKSTTKGMAFGNILFGGIIGAGVDMGSGAAYEYPTTLQVPFQCKPTDARVKASSATPRLGLRVEDHLATPGGSPASSDGVIVTFVHPGSSAERAGLIPGNIITACNGRTVLNIESFSQAIRTLAGEKVLHFTLTSDGASRQVDLVLTTSTDF